VRLPSSPFKGKWCKNSVKSFTITRNACRRCRAFRGLRMDVGCCWNMDFLAYLFCDHGFAMQFLKYVGLIRSKVQCYTCGRDITWSAETSIPERFRWQFRKKVAPESRSIKHGSWFQQSNLMKGCSEKIGSNVSAILSPRR